MQQRFPAPAPRHVLAKSPTAIRRLKISRSDGLNLPGTKGKLHLQPVPMEQTEERRPNATGDMAWAGLVIRKAPRGCGGFRGPSGSSSAPLGGVRHVLGSDLRSLVHLVRGHFLVGAVMGRMADVMAARLGVGVQCTLLRIHRLARRSGFGNWRRRRLLRGCRERGHGEHGCGKQRGGDGFQHGSLLSRKGHKTRRSDDRAF